jgi:NADPH-dependent 2,4-dienoyl-CoA reductase/sulfur reductase-like enzyme
MVSIGAGPAGLAAAIEAARNGLQVVVFDENDRPGGQLFKQIHKFFGSKEHRAQERGFNIGRSLLEEARELGVEVVLDSVVLGLYEGGAMNVMIRDRIEQVKAEKTLVATGASENMIPFPGWTLPGVIGAGAAQTVANIHGIRPGKNLLMVGSGNVGLVVSYQMLQAGCRVAAVIDAVRSGAMGSMPPRLPDMVCHF